MHYIYAIFTLETSMDVEDRFDIQRVESVVFVCYCLFVWCRRRPEHAGLLRTYASLNEKHCALPLLALPFQRSNSQIILSIGAALFVEEVAKEADYVH